MSGWVGVIIEALPYIYQGVSGYYRNKEQSEMEADAALANSIAIKEMAAMNAKSFLAMAALNSQLGLIGAQAENTRIRALTAHNVQKKLFLSQYESELLDNEANLVAEAADIDLRQLERKHAESIGEIRTHQAASGAIIDQDSPQQAVEAAKEKQELERFVVRRGADIQMAKLKDKAAMSRWEGINEAASMTLEGQLLEQSNLINGVLKGFGVSAQGSIDANSMIFNGGINAGQAYTTGMQKSDAYYSDASTSFWTGIFGAGSTVAKSYVNEKKEEDASKSLLND